MALGGVQFSGALAPVDSIRPAPALTQLDRDNGRIGDAARTAHWLPPRDTARLVALASSAAVAARGGAEQTGLDLNRRRGIIRGFRLTLEDG